MFRDFLFFTLALFSVIIVGSLMTLISFVPTAMIFALPIYHFFGNMTVAVAIGMVEGFIAMVVFFYHYGWIVKNVINFYENQFSKR